MKKRIAVTLLAALLIAALYVFFGRGLIFYDPDLMADDILMEYQYRHAVPTVSIPDAHPVNTHKAGKDQ
jgi:hypothetical protein